MTDGLLHLEQEYLVPIARSFPISYFIQSQMKTEDQIEDDLKPGGSQNKMKKIIAQNEGYDNCNEINFKVSLENQQHRRRLKEMGASRGL